MSKLSEFLTNIANAIRNKKGTTEPINAQNFASEIEGIKGNTLKNLLDYLKVIDNLFSRMSNIFDLTGYIDYDDTSNVTSMNGTFYYCYNLVELPPLDTRNVTNMTSIVQSCSKLRKICQLNLINVTKADHMFYDCPKLEDVTLLNIKINLQVSSGSSYGHLLTLESLLGLCQECVNVNSSRTLTVGTTNMTKLSNVYVKLTNEPEEDETLPKLPMVQCDSTDEGAMLIKDYMALKSWNLA